MLFLNSIVLANLLYLFLIAGIWLAALALVSPGTGVLEVLAFIALALVGIGTLWVPFNAWAIGVMVLGLVCFIGSLRRKNEEIWLVFAAIALVFGSAFLFRSPTRGPAVSPLLAIPVSLLTVGFFWLAIRKVLQAYHSAPAFDLDRLIGLVGEARTRLDPTGSVYLDGELWTASAEQPIEAGAHVRVAGREKLILLVEPYHESKEE